MYNYLTWLSLSHAFNLRPEIFITYTKLINHIYANYFKNIGFRLLNSLHALPDKQKCCDENIE